MAEPQWFRGPAGAVFTAAPNAAFTEKYIAALVDRGEWVPVDAPETEEPEPTPAPAPTPEPKPAEEPTPAPVKRGRGRPRKTTN